MSNKTPINPPNETESAPNSGTRTVTGRNPKRLLFALAIIAFGIFIMAGGIVGLLDNKSRLIAPAGTIIIETVNTPETRTLGLSGRDFIGDNEGMLFVFETATIENCFWMKDMQFAIDMIWLDQDRKVITVEQSVDPSTFPESFCPDSVATYGLEVQANRADELGIVPGETLRF